MFNFLKKKYTEEDENSFEYLDRMSRTFLSESLLSPESKVENAKYKAMRDDFLSLSGQTKHDKEKLRLIMKDWVDYCNYLFESENYRDLMTVSMNYEEDDKLSTELEKVRSLAELIEKKFEIMLGNKAEITKTNKILFPAS